MDLAGKQRVLLFFLFGYLLSIFTVYVKTAYWGYNLDDVNFLYNHREKFSDMVEVFAMVVNHDPYFRSEGWHIPFYPPAAYGLVAFFKFIGLDSFREWLLLHVTLISLVLLMLRVEKFIRFEDQTMLLVFGGLWIANYAFLYGIDRGNLESLVVILCGVGILTKNKFLAAVAFGIGGAIKLVPFVFFIRFLNRADYKFIFVGGFCSVFVTAIALASFDAGFFEQIRQFLINVSTHGSVVMTNPAEYWSYTGPKEYIMQGSTTDLFDAFRILSLKSNFYVPGDGPFMLYRILFGVLIAIFIYKSFKMDYRQKMVCAVLLAIVFLPLSYIPRLSLLVPLIGLIWSDRRFFWLVVGSFFLLIPKSGIQLFHKVDINSVLIPVILTPFLIRNIFWVR